MRDYLLAYPWPGNLREMYNVVSSLYVFGEEGQEVDSLEHLPEMPAEASSHSLNFEEYMAPHHQRLLIRLMRHTNGNLKKAATLYGKARNTLINDLKKFGIDAEEFR